MSEGQRAKCLKGLEELQGAVEQARSLITEGNVNSQKIEQIFGWLAGKAEGLRQLLVVPVSNEPLRRRGLKMQTVLLDD
jgi:hypothetical protein